MHLKLAAYAFKSPYHVLNEKYPFIFMILPMISSAIQFFSSILRKSIRVSRIKRYIQYTYVYIDVFYNRASKLCNLSRRGFCKSTLMNHSDNMPKLYILSEGDTRTLMIKTSLTGKPRDKLEVIEWLYNWTVLINEMNGQTNKFLQCWT